MTRTSNKIPTIAPANVQRVNACNLIVSAKPWPFALKNATQIEAHWIKAQRDNPAYFNGVIHVITAYAIIDSVLRATFARSDFASFLYWREQPNQEAFGRDGFGSAIIRSADGHILLGKQRAGHMNAGLAYPPGGLIDARDVDSAGRIAIEKSIARELSEETGLVVADIERKEGFIITDAEPSISIAIEYQSTLQAEELRKRILCHIASEAEAELEDIIIVKTKSDIDKLAMPAFASSLVTQII